MSHLTRENNMEIIDYYLIMMKNQFKKRFNKVSRHGLPYKIHLSQYGDELKNANFETWTKKEAEKVIAEILKSPRIKKLQEQGQIFEFKLNKVAQ
tara:strand:+ start:436 stop:720 length:285 start_codon:yes stop_codon:yes gene_type:complete